MKLIRGARMLYAVCVPQVLEQSVWVLGNLAGEGPTTRDTVLAAGVLRPLGANTIIFALSHYRAEIRTHNDSVSPLLLLLFSVLLGALLGFAVADEDRFMGAEQLL